MFDITWGVVQILLGAFLAILTTIVIESVRKPKLELKIAKPFGMTYSQEAPAQNAYWLQLVLINKPLLWLWRWMSRSAALQCHGTIQFCDINGNPIYPKMTIRWSTSPQPLAIGGTIEEGRDHYKRLFIFDPDRFVLEQRKDIYPGELESLDVAVRFDDDDECYAWSNENYFSEPMWRNENWIIPQGRYLAKVTITSSGEKCERLFRLMNEGPKRNFHLEKAQRNDKVIG
jgi:hypothetical protein